MILSDVFDFFYFWQTVGGYKILRFFWYAFIFEFPRYVVMDLIFAGFYYADKRWIKRGKYAVARSMLFAQRPLISILIPGKNEGENVFKLVRSLREQTYDKVEIIVVDDGSDDETPTICKNLKKNGLIDLYLRNDVRGGKGSASNLGLRYANGDFILLLDADSSFDRDSIEQILMPFYVDPQIGAIGGNVKVRNLDASVCASLQAIEYIKTIAIGRAVASLLGIYRVIPGAFGAFRRDVVQRIGGWDVGPGLDGDITVKIRKLGYKIHFAKDAVCYTSVPATYRGHIKQRLRWYKSLVRFRIRKHKDVYWPDKNFSLLNFLSFAENVFFNVILDFKWIIYIIDITYNASSLAKYIIPMNYFIYLFFNIIQFSIAISVSERRRDDAKLFYYLPLIPLYFGLYLRTVRTVAYVQEFFFKASYKDPWNPWKVSRRALKERL